MATSKGRDLAVWVTVFTLLILVSLCLRFYTIFRIKKRSLRKDDYLITAAVAALIANEGLVFWEIANDLGEHTASLPWDIIVVHIKASVGYSFTWTIGTTLCKLSILFLYLELFRTSKIFRRLIWTMVALNVIFAIVFMVLFNSNCKKVSDSWDPVYSQTRCRLLAKEEIASVASTLGLDFLVVVAPIPVVWKLQMPVRNKVAVCGMFSLGFTVVGVMTWRVVTMSRNKGGIAVDLVYDNYLLLLQSNLELWLGILAANLPSLAPILDVQAFSKIVEYLSIKSFRSKSSSTRHLPMITFGRGGVSRRANNDDLEMTRDDFEVPFRPEVMKHQSFEVSSHRPSTQTDQGHPVSIV